MARKKEFDRDEVLQKAMHVFWDKGYAASSTEDLVEAMGIGRQSVYDTYGDKAKLFREALLLYSRISLAEMRRRLAASTPLRFLKGELLRVAEQTPEERRRGCMAVNTIAELGNSAVESIAPAGNDREKSAELFEEAAARAKALGELPPGLDEHKAGQFVLSAINGLRISAMSGASQEDLRAIAGAAVAALHCI